MTRIPSNQALLDLAAFGNVEGIAEPLAGDPGHFIKHARDGFAKIGTAIDDFRRSVQQIRDQKGSRLTEEGVKAELGALGQRTLADTAITAIRDRFIPQAKQKLESLDGMVADEFRNKSSMSDAAERIALWEIRDTLAQRIGTDDLKIRMALDDAIDKGDTLTFRALTEAPRSIALLSEDQIDAAREKWFSNQTGEVARQRVELRRAIQRLETRLDQFRRIVTSEAGLPQADPLRVIAGLDAPVNNNGNPVQAVAVGAA